MRFPQFGKTAAHGPDDNRERLDGALRCDGELLARAPTEMPQGLGHPVELQPDRGPSGFAQPSDPLENPFGASQGVHGGTAVDVPLVTVVIPCRDQAHFLTWAIRSAVRQDYPRVETIVVDDGSTDDTANVAAAAGALVVRQPCLGVAAARNAGLRLASGKYIVFLDADDELLPDAIASGVAILEQEPRRACVVRRCQLMDKYRRRLPLSSPVVEGDDLYRAWLLDNFAWTPGVAFFRRDQVERIGGFPAHLGPASDYAVYLALARAGMAIFDPRDAVRYRQHCDSMSRDPALMLRAIVGVLRSERPHVPAHAGREFALGKRRWRAFYSDQIVERLRRDWRAGKLNLWCLAAIWTLVRYAPRALTIHIVRKVSRVARGLPPSAVVPGQFADIPPTQEDPAP